MASNTWMSKSQSTSARCSRKQLQSNCKCFATSSRRCPLRDPASLTSFLDIAREHSSAQLLGSSSPARASSTPMCFVSVLQRAQKGKRMMCCVRVF
eukprot:scaffold14118_cov18-Tisochrysis_lutea.AAC.1